LVEFIFANRNRLREVSLAYGAEDSGSLADGSGSISATGRTDLYEGGTIMDPLQAAVTAAVMVLTDDIPVLKTSYPLHLPKYRGKTE
jgi:hypothetical protein